MKKIIGSLFLCCLLGCYETKRDCGNFKKGKFRFEFEIEGKKKVTIFERKDSIEIETFEGKTDTASIRWVNDCEYVLKKLHPKNKAEEKAVVIKILRTNGNSYTFEFGILGNAEKQRGTATKI